MNLCGVSQKLFNDYIYEELKFLNDIFCLDVILEAEVYRREFQAHVSKYPIKDIYVYDQTYGSIYNVKESIFEEYENEDLRKVMKFYRIPDHDETLAFRFTSGDFYSSKHHSRTHKGVTTLNDVSLQVPESAQADKYYRPIGHYFGKDNYELMLIFFTPLFWLLL